MKSRRAERDEGSKTILRDVEEHGLRLQMLPNGECIAAHHPNCRVIVYSNERYLGGFLAALVVDGGGRWKLVRDDGAGDKP